MHLDLRRSPRPTTTAAAAPGLGASTSFAAGAASAGLNLLGVLTLGINPLKLLGASLGGPAVQPPAGPQGESLAGGRPSIDAVPAVGLRRSGSAGRGGAGEAADGGAGPGRASGSLTSRQQHQSQGPQGLQALYQDFLQQGAGEPGGGAGGVWLPGSGVVAGAHAVADVEAVLMWRDPWRSARALAGGLYAVVCVQQLGRGGWGVGVGSGFAAASNLQMY